ncbi:MAG: hypothetical protein ACREYF_00615 [Gammaproteobacteria bacterium]
MSELSITITNILAQCGWVAFSYLYISIGEHQIHKGLMHDKPLPARVYEASPYLLDAFDAHAMRHHRKWYKAFDYEPDPRGREENLPIPMKETMLMLVAAFPLWSPIFLFSIRGGCIFLATALLHNRLWSAFHRQMHIPRRVFYQDCAFFRFLAANHFLHHQDNRRNFNVVFPFADFLFGTWATPTRADLQELLRLGYVKPRSSVARAVVEKRREATALQRAQPALRGLRTAVVPPTP